MVLKKDIHKGKQPACTGLTQLVPVVHVCALWISCFMKVAIFGSKLATSKTGNPDAVRTTNRIFKLLFFRKSLDALDA